MHQFFAFCRSKYFAASIFRGFTDVKKKIPWKNMQRLWKENAKKMRKRRKKQSATEKLLLTSCVPDLEQQLSSRQPLGASNVTIMSDTNVLTIRFWSLKLKPNSNGKSMSWFQITYVSPCLRVCRVSSNGRRRLMCDWKSFDTLTQGAWHVSSRQKTTYSYDPFSITFWWVSRNISRHQFFAVLKKNAKSAKNWCTRKIDVLQ